MSFHNLSARNGRARREEIYFSDSDEDAASFDSLDSLEKAQSKPHTLPSAITRALNLGFRSSHYEALPPSGSLRLLTLLPGKGAAKVSCTLTSVRLSDNPVYEALSYTWGDPRSPKHTISLNGKDCSVRENLFWALLYLRDPANARPLWVDAICINQDNATERDSQVKQMGKIYSQASQVIIWLGRATEGSRLAMDLLDQIASSPQSTDEEILEMITSRPGVEYKLRRLLHLRIYWTRLWILQEVILAKSIVIYCGKHRLPWASLTVSIRRLQEGMPHFKSPPHAFSRPSRPIYTALSRSLDSIFSIRLDSIRSERYTSSPPDTDLRKLMGICQWSECSVRRDKLYGCLGMFDSTMPVDYQKPPFEVYTDAIRHIKHPNVRGPSDLCDFYTVRFSRIVQRLLSGPMTSSSSVVPCFRIKGILGGTIIGLGKPSSTQGPAWTGWRANESARQIPKVVDESGEPNIAGLFESMPPEYGEGVHLSSQNCKPHYFTVHLSAEGVSPKFPEIVPTSGNVPVAKNSNDTSSDSRKFVASSTKPLTGYAPPSALVGDLVVRFLYSDTSIIIRRSKEGFSFVGRAFIPRQYKSEPSPYISESREIDNVTLSGDIIGRDELALHTEHLDIVIDGELLQFISNYKEFEKNT